MASANMPEWQASFESDFWQPVPSIHMFYKFTKMSEHELSITSVSCNRLSIFVDRYLII